MSPIVTPTACNVSYAQFLTKSYARQIGIVLEVDWDAISSQCITFFSWRLSRPFVIDNLPFMMVNGLMFKATFLFAQHNQSFNFVIKTEEICKEAVQDQNIYQNCLIFSRLNESIFFRTNPDIGAKRILEKLPHVQGKTITTVK